MNKYQQVLDKFINDGHRLTHRERNEFGTILQELVDKETPKKVIEYTSEITNSEEAYTFCTCPNCRKYLNLNQNYCDVCGQALDWSDEDEKM